MFVHTIHSSTAAHNQNYRPFNYIRPKEQDNITLVEVLFQCKTSNTVFGIRPAFRLDMTKSVQENSFLFCRNKIDILAGQIPENISEQKAFLFARNFHTCISLGNPSIILLFGKGRKPLDSLCAVCNHFGYQAERKDANGICYFVAVKAGTAFTFPQGSEIERVMGIRLCRAIMNTKRAARGGVLS